MNGAHCLESRVSTDFRSVNLKDDKQHGMQCQQTQNPAQLSLNGVCILGSCHGSTSLTMTWVFSTYSTRNCNTPRSRSRAQRLSRTQGMPCWSSVRRRSSASWERRSLFWVLAIPIHNRAVCLPARVLQCSAPTLCRWHRAWREFVRRRCLPTPVLDRKCL